MTPETFGRFLGALVFVLILGTVLTSPIALAIQWRYRAAVRRAMAAASGAASPESGVPLPPAPVPPPPPGPELVELGGAALSDAARALVRDGRRARLQLGAVYGVAGLAFVAAMSVIFGAVEGGGVEGWFYAMACLWPVLLTVLRASAAGRRASVAAMTGYLLFWPLLALALGYSATFLMFPFVTISIPTVLTVLAWNRVVGANGPLVLGGTLFVVGAMLAALMTWIGVGLLLRGASYLIPVLPALAVLAAGRGVLRAGARWLARLYREKRISDEMLVLDACWLVLGAWQGMLMMEALRDRPAVALLAAPTVLLPFVAYRMALGASLRASGLGAGRPRPLKLLVLRTFGARRRSERLFGELGRRWRHLGSLNLIAGTDLATHNLEPHELVDFMGGRLSARFVKGDAEARAAVDTLDHAPDPDGRYRSNELFCHDDTWRVAVRRAAEVCDAVLLDLRGFTKENRGCVYELSQLVHRVPLRRVVFVVDGETRLDQVEALARRAWTVMAADSPNRQPGNDTLRMYRMDRQTPAAVEALVALLCEAAAPALAATGAARPADMALAG